MMMVAEDSSVKRMRPQEDDAQHHSSYNFTANELPHSRKRRVVEPEPPNHVLLITVINPLYPVTVEVIRAVLSPYGQPARIVIFRKNGVQALVEMVSVAGAVRVKESLSGVDVYAGCCTLRIEYAKPTKLNVYRNDADSWDYTNMALNTQPVIPSPDAFAKTGILPEPLPSFPMLHLGLDPLRMPAHMYAPAAIPETLLAGYRMAASPAGFQAALAAAAAAAGGGGGSIAHLPGVDFPPVAPSAPLAVSAAAAPHCQIQAEMAAAAAAAAAAACAGGNSSLAALSSAQCGVFMVYGLSEQMSSADRLFNLFCLYGNIARIKFLKTKQGCAMIQMGDALSVERAISNLNNIELFGTRVQLGYSKQTLLNNVQQPHTMADGTLSYKDYTACKNNRFLTPGSNNKNRIQAPSKVLHFFNTPPHLSLDALIEIFRTSGAATFSKISIFPSKTERSSSGLLEFGSVSAALEALVTCNHKPIGHPSSKFPFIMKLCFSSSKPGVSNAELVRTL